jgi:hypothetical protein
MTHPPHDRRPAGGGRRIPKNRARLLLVLTFVLVLVVVFGYLLLVSQAGGN